MECFDSGDFGSIDSADIGDSFDSNGMDVDVDVSTDLVDFSVGDDSPDIDNDADLDMDNLLDTGASIDVDSVGTEIASLETSESDIFDGLGDTSSESLLDVEENIELSDVNNNIEANPLDEQQGSASSFDEWLETASRDDLLETRRNLEEIKNEMETSSAHGEAFGETPMKLIRDPDNLREIGYSAIEDNLEIIRDNYRDEGMADGEDLEKLIQQKRELLQQEFEQDAFHYGENYGENRERADDSFDETCAEKINPSEDEINERTINELETLLDSLDLGEGDLEVEQIAGTYKEIKGSEIKGEVGEAHHIIPQSLVEQNKEIETAIELEKRDHRALPTTGGIINRKYESFLPDSPQDIMRHRDEIMELIDRGEYAEAFRNEVLEIRKNAFDNGEEGKYDGAIKQALEAEINYIKEHGVPKSKS